MYVRKRLFLMFNLSLAINFSIAQTKKPNIIVIMADDMGYADLGIMGSEINTPNLDALANNGLLLTHFYNNGKCCPSRASLLTGLYSHEAGIGLMTENKGFPSYQGYLNNSCITLAEVLKTAGYTTAISGKWHVGEEKEHWPTQRGFDYFYGIPQGRRRLFLSIFGEQRTMA